MWREDLKEIEEEVKGLLARAEDIKAVKDIKARFLGRKGKLTLLLKRIVDLPKEERPEFGKAANKLKGILQKMIDDTEKGLSEGKKTSYVDPTLPGRSIPRGSIHPITQVAEEIFDVFLRMGFQLVEGPEVETDYHNFEALNIPKDHPARDMHDTFYVSENILLRTHTSPIQIRVMEKQSPPVKIICPGKVYRRDSDITHTPMFHQVEGLMVDEGITFAHLKGVLTQFVHQIFGKDVDLRFRPSFFPFTEPSAEVDIQCVICKGAGCRVCGDTGWLEILGSGMVDPEVFKAVGYDTKRYTGFAFGLGVERVAMLKLGIDDIRLFFENDLRFLSQF